MTKKAFRDLKRMAEDEGVENVWIDLGTPHDRIVGLVDERPFEIVCSRNCLDAPHRRKMARANIRREVERIRTNALWLKAQELVNAEKAVE